MGSPRKKDTYRICEEIEEKIGRENCMFDYIHITDYELLACRGCNQCFNKSEKVCPCKDQLHEIEEKIASADGLIMASPVYAYQVPGLFKVLIDRLAYYFHRQKLIGLPCVNIITSEGGGNKAVEKYLKMLSVGWGMHFIGSISLIAPKYFQKQSNGVFHHDPKYKSKVNRTINRITDDFVKAIVRPNVIEPSFYDLIMFNGLRSKIYTSKADYNYWAEQNWIDADYFREGKMGWLKRYFSRFMKVLIKGVITKEKKRIKGGGEIW